MSDNIIEIKNEPEEVPVQPIYFDVTLLTNFDYGANIKLLEQDIHNMHQMERSENYAIFNLMARIMAMLQFNGIPSDFTSVLNLEGFISGVPDDKNVKVISNYLYVSSSQKQVMALFPLPTEKKNDKSHPATHPLTQNQYKYVMSYLRFYSYFIFDLRFEEHSIKKLGANPRDLQLRAILISMIQAKRLPDVSNPGQVIIIDNKNILELLEQNPHYTALNDNIKNLVKQKIQNMLDYARVYKHFIGDFTPNPAIQRANTIVTGLIQGGITDYQTELQINQAIESNKERTEENYKQMEKIRNRVLFFQNQQNKTFTQEEISQGINKEYCINKEYEFNNQLIELQKYHKRLEEESRQLYAQQQQHLPVFSQNLNVQGSLVPTLPQITAPIEQTYGIPATYINQPWPQIPPPISFYESEPWPTLTQFVATEEPQLELPEDFVITTVPIVGPQTPALLPPPRVNSTRIDPDVEFILTPRTNSFNDIMNAFTPSNLATNQIPSEAHPLDYTQGQDFQNANLTQEQQQQRMRDDEIFGLFENTALTEAPRIIEPNPDTPVTGNYFNRLYNWIGDAVTNSYMERVPFNIEENYALFDETTLMNIEFQREVNANNLPHGQLKGNERKIMYILSRIGYNAIQYGTIQYENVQRILLSDVTNLHNNQGRIDALNMYINDINMQIAIERGNHNDTTRLDLEANYIRNVVIPQLAKFDDEIRNNNAEDITDIQALLDLYNVSQFHKEPLAKQILMIKLLVLLYKESPLRLRQYFAHSRINAILRELYGVGYKSLSKEDKAKIDYLARRILIFGDHFDYNSIVALPSLRSMMYAVNQKIRARQINDNTRRQLNGENIIDYNIEEVENFEEYNPEANQPDRSIAYLMAYQVYEELVKAGDYINFPSIPSPNIAGMFNSIKDSISNVPEITVGGYGVNDFIDPVINAPRTIFEGIGDTIRSNMPYVERFAPEQIVITPATYLARLGESLTDPTSLRAKYTVVAAATVMFSIAYYSVYYYFTEAQMRQDDAFDSFNNYAPSLIYGVAPKKKLTEAERVIMLHNIALQKMIDLNKLLYDINGNVYEGDYEKMMYELSSIAYDEARDIDYSMEEPHDLMYYMPSNNDSINYASMNLLTIPQLMIDFIVTAGFIVFKPGQFFDNLSATAEGKLKDIFLFYPSVRLLCVRLVYLICT